MNTATKLTKTEQTADYIGSVVQSWGIDGDIIVSKLGVGENPNTQTINVDGELYEMMKGFAPFEFFKKNLDYYVEKVIGGYLEEYAAGIWVVVEDREA